MFLHVFGHTNLSLFYRVPVKVTDIPGTEVLMLPLAYSIGTIFNFILHWYFIRRDLWSMNLYY